MFGKIMLGIVCLGILCSAQMSYADDYLVNHQSKIGKHVETVVKYNDLDSTVISYTITGFDQKSIPVGHELFQKISLFPAAYMDFDHVGHPMIPELSTSLLIPDTAEMGVKVTKGEYYEIKNFILAPWRGNIKRSVDPATVPYLLGEEYSRDAWFPEAVAKLRQPFVLHDVRGIVVEAHPFQYNPVTKVLRVYTQLEMEVFNAGESQVNTINRSVYGFRPDKEFENLYKGHFSNYAMNRAPRALPPESGDMLVISHGPFMPNIQPLVDWKNAMGLKTTLKDVASIGNTSIAIKNYIKNVYQTSNLAYVLLVGDAAQVATPMSYSSQDPTYTLMDSDNYPDLFLGRFSAETKTHVDTLVKKALDYEKVPHDVAFGGWDAKAMGIASSEGSGAGIYGLGDWEHSGLIRDALLLYGFTQVDEIYEPTATKAMVAAGLHDGRRLLNYTGHGGPQGWGTTGFGNNDVYKLKNKVAMPVINSVACNTGQFHNYTCLGEAFTRHTHLGDPSGGLIFQGSSIGMSWAPPMYGQCNHGVGNKFGFVDNFWMENYLTYGGCFYAGMISMMQLAGSSGVNEFKHWHYLGDPSLHINGAPGLKGLEHDGWQCFVSTGDVMSFNLAMGSGCAGLNYFLFGGLSGTDPGTPLAGGYVLPLNWDVFSNLVCLMCNGPIFQKFMGVLGSNGEANSVFSTTAMAPLDPRLHGLHIYFAAGAWDQSGKFKAVTNPKMITIIETMPTP